jgi:hypothetical protein
MTVNVDEDIAKEWLHWMQETYLPTVMNTGHFQKQRILRLLNEQPDATGITYAVQYETTSLSELEQYLNEHAGKHQQMQMTRFGQKCVAFQTVLEEI